MTSRRHFLAQSATLAAGIVASPATSFATEASQPFCPTEQASLCGEWQFRTDPEDKGVQQGFFRADPPGDWHTILVPHTWQVDARFVDYRGIAWYRCDFDVPEQWAGSAIRVE